MNNAMKIFKTLQHVDILLKGINKKIENKTKEPRHGFVDMLFGTLGSSIL